MRTSGTRGGRDPVCSVLIVTEDIYEHTDILMGMFLRTRLLLALISFRYY